ncbi:MAG: hypothetical protein AAF675_13795 [Pseudomonadota bacterium]
MSTLTQTYPCPHPSRFQAMSAFWAWLQSAIQHTVHHTPDHDHVSGLSDHLLRDIGLERRGPEAPFMPLRSEDIATSVHLRDIGYSTR